jgi:hypothetical protein
LSLSDASEYIDFGLSLGYFKGSIFVTRAASRHLNGEVIYFGYNVLQLKYSSPRFQELLQNTRFQEDIPFMVEKFDKSTKLAFRDPTDPQYIKFGRARDKDASLGIRAGQLKLEG